jgi:perosamine synthetase
VKYPVSRPNISQKEKDFVRRAMESGYVSSTGAFVTAFEQLFASYIGVKHALSTSSGTGALHLAILAHGIGPGDEVIVPDLSFIATANAISYTGATPVFVDVSSYTLTINPLEIIGAITPRTKAIIPVHLYGHPAVMDTIMAIAKVHNLAVIEDAAEAHGAEYHGKKVGSFGTGAFSFYGNKIITTGEGGMLTTNDTAVYERAKLIRDHGMQPDRKYWHTVAGHNYRMTNMQAALGCAQLERIDSFIQKRDDILGWYEQELDRSLNPSAPRALPVNWMVCFETPDRARLMERLKTAGIDSRPYFYPMSDMPMYKHADTPIAHSRSLLGVNLPTYVDLEESDVKYICNVIKEVL